MPAETSARHLLRQTMVYKRFSLEQWAAELGIASSIFTMWDPSRADCGVSLSGGNGYSDATSHPLREYFTVVTAQRRSDLDTQLGMSGPQQHDNRWSDIDYKDDARLWRLLFGLHPSKSSILRWLRHPLVFYERDYPWVIMQLVGGPCGIIAAIQNLTLIYLLYVPFVAKAVPNCVLDSLVKDTSLIRRCVTLAIATIIWRSRPGGGLAWLAWIAPTTRYLGGSRADLGLEGGGEALFDKLGSFREAGCDVKLRAFSCVEELVDEIYTHLGPLFCHPGMPGLMSIAVSCVFTRTMDKCEFEDFDVTADTSLIGEFGYCNQELVNLFILGSAVSHTFDGSKDLYHDGGVVLKGAPCRSLVGYLTEMEAKGHCDVGLRLKHPLTPGWILCRNSHFTSVVGLSLDDSKMTIEEVIEEGVRLTWDEIDFEKQGFLLPEAFEKLKQIFGIPANARITTQESNDILLRNEFVLWMKDYYKKSDIISAHIEQNKWILADHEKSASGRFLHIDGMIANLNAHLEGKGLPKPRSVSLLVDAFTCPEAADSPPSSSDFAEIAEVFGTLAPTRARMLLLSL